MAEAKFRESRHLFEPLIQAKDAEGILAMLTFPAQEAAVAERVGRKAALFAESVSEGGAPCRVAPEAVMRLWCEAIMPMTKVVQARHPLLQRINRLHRSLPPRPLPPSSHLTLAHVYPLFPLFPLSIISVSGEVSLEAT